MQKYITKAVDTFFSQTLGFKCSNYDKYSPTKVYVSEVSINIEDKIETFYISMNHKMLSYISSAMLFEDEPDNETLIDLIGECANLIVGNAKILFEEEENIETSLSTPIYLGYFEEEFSKEFSDSYYYEINGEHLMIAVVSKCLETL